ncbi:MAG: DNA-3-methyladenine glycosylase [Patescibacteria group bacterium]
MSKKVTVTKLRRVFYTQDTLKIAKEFLGKFIIRKVGKKKRIGMIVETEAYVGPQDRASHAFGGKKTPCNRAEYLIGGHIYIYLVYGMYWQLNISTGKADVPECVLIRALEPIFSDKIFNFQFSITPGDFSIKIKKGSRPLNAPYGRVQPNKIQNSKFKIPKQIINLANGPGKLCRWLKLDKSFYAEDLTKSKRIWLEDWGIKLKKRDIVVAPRVGIDYAGPLWSKKPWRFYIKGNSFVSKL